MFAFRACSRPSLTFPPYLAKSICVRGLRWNHRQKALRILFCGSDEFSATALKRLNQERRLNPSLIESLEVVVKQGKLAGRGMKTVRDVPIRSMAEELCLPLHEISTFTGWSPPSPFDLIIAVSFGLKVPPRLLSGASFGGLNLHPSLLPDLRGPAPLHHTLLQGRTSSGITLQTLHPHEFDQGLVVAQRPFNVPRDGACSFEELREHVSPMAAELLIESLNSGLIVRQDLQPRSQVDGRDLTHARKLIPEDAHVDWQTWPAERILRTQRALGSVWSKHTTAREGKELRVQWHGFSRLQARVADLQNTQSEHLKPGTPQIISSTRIPGIVTEAEATVVMPSSDGQLLQPDSITIEGRKRHESPISGMQYLLKR